MPDHNEPNIKQNNHSPISSEGEEDPERNEDGDDENMCCEENNKDTIIKNKLTGKNDVLMMNGLNGGCSDNSEMSSPDKKDELSNNHFCNNNNKAVDSNNKSRSRLFDHAFDKSPKMNFLLPHQNHGHEFDERAIEQDLMQVRRLTLEKAQADLLAGFGLGFPMLSGLHYLPTGHPFLPAAASGLHAKSLAPADLLNLSTLIQHQSLMNSPPPMAANKQQISYDNNNMRHKSPAVDIPGSDSPEPEDLSMGLRNNGSIVCPMSPRQRRRQFGLNETQTPGSLAIDDYADLRSLSPADESSINASGSSSQHQQNWSFEEQFKQLYDLGTDQKRKEFLDDLFSFMQKRGTPVTRIPIMAKQVLDLYELYKLVVSHGGLVEVINKKMWREITKGLNLPSSITSAAFTLRTQYMKYLYPYECEKEKLSSPAELQSAIDGNRREGRRSGYHPYSQISPTLLPAAARHHLNGGMPTNLQDDDGMVPASSLTQQAIAAAYREQAMAIEAAQRHFEMSQRESQRRATSDGASSCSNESLTNEDNRLTPLDATTTPQRPSLYANGSRPLIRAQTNSGSALSMHQVNGHQLAAGAMTNGHLPDNNPILAPIPQKPDNNNTNNHANGIIGVEDRPQRSLSTGDKTSLANDGTSVSTNLLPTTHIKVTSRNDGQSKLDSSLVVSMEINGTMYQGVLFAQSNR